MSEQTEVDGSEALAQMLAAVRLDGRKGHMPVTPAAALGECVGKSIRVATLLATIETASDNDTGGAREIANQLCTALAVLVPPEWKGALGAEIRALKSEVKGNAT